MDSLLISIVLFTVWLGAGGPPSGAGSASGFSIVSAPLGVIVIRKFTIIVEGVTIDNEIVSCAIPAPVWIV